MAPGGNVIEITSKEQWDKLLADAAAQGKVVIVDFTAVWCGPCQMIGPVFVRNSEKYTDLLFVKVDVDANAELAGEAGVTAMPTFQVYKDGKQVEQIIGGVPSKLTALIEKYSTIRE